MKNIFLIGCLLVLVFLVGCKPTTETKPSAPISPQFYITYTLTMVSNNHVGNEWSTSVTVNGTRIRNEAPLDFVPGSRITVKATVTEGDNVPDCASGSLKLRIVDEASDSVIITVKENKGRYAGNTAKWKLTCTIHEK